MDERIGKFFSAALGVLKYFQKTIAVVSKERIIARIIALIDMEYRLPLVGGIPISAG